MTDTTTSALMAGAAAASPAAPAAAPAATPAVATVDTTQAQAAANGQQLNPAAVPWLGEGVDPEMVGYVQNKGWKSPAEMAEGYRNLEKLRGVPAERLLTLPAADADEATKAAFYERLGRPKEASGYDFKLGEDANYDGAVKQVLHKAGLSTEQAKAVIAGYDGIVQGITKAQQEAQIARVQTEHQQLMAEWGQAAQQNLAMAQHGRDLLGLSNEDVDAIGAALGHKRTMQLLHGITARSGEADFVVGKTAGGKGAMTPGQAQAQINAWRKDKDWSAKYLAGDATVRAEFKRVAAFLEG